MKLTKKLEAEVRQVYHTFWKSLLSVDMKTFNALLDDDFRQIGTTEAEMFFNKKAVARYTKAAEEQIAGNIELRNQKIKIESLDQYILITDLCDCYVKIDHKWTFYSRCRSSFLLHNTKAGWKFIQQHTSLPDNRTDDGETVALKQVSKENLELRDAIKRRTIELENKNRELEIETALEKVRAVAMSMNKQDDALYVCKQIFEELNTLGFADVRNTLINFWDDKNQQLLDYDYSDFAGTQFSRLAYNSHPAFAAFQKKIRKAKDAFAKLTVANDELKSWRQRRKASGEYDDPRLKKISALYYYFYSTGIGALGISTFSPIPKDKLEVLKRFRNVFGLAYQRYLDIQKAEAQAREAQIQLALERVRARTMAMHKSDELADVINLLQKELTKLEFTLNNCILWIMNEKPAEAIWWVAPVSNTNLPVSYKIPFPLLPYFKSVLKGWKERNPIWVYELKGKDKQATDNYIFNSTPLSAMPSKVKKAFEKSEKVYISFSFYNYGGLHISTPQPLTEEQLDIINRFSKVFDQTYTRFLDLQKAEAQAKEAQIEAALERVRAKAMSMHSSKDLSETLTVFYRELKSLGVVPRRCGIAIMDKAERLAEVTTMNTTEQGDSIEVIGYINMSGHKILDEVYENWLIQKEYHAVLKGNEIKQYYQVLKPQMDFPDYSHDIVQYGYYFMFKEGDVYAWTEKELLEDELKIYRRFTTVISLTYKRYKDLQHAEAQAREAQIEAALERVRSRSMGMQKSDELKEVIKLVYEQLTHLKIKLDHAGFVVDYKPKGDWTFWIADERDIPSKITHPYFESVWANQFNEAKEKDEDIFATHLNFEEKNKFYNALLSYVPGIPEASRDFYLSCPALAATTVLLENVGLYIENFSGTPYSDEENAMLMRFGKVFQQTYTRFLDLQKAEAQAREAQIEAGLERVRSRTMAMHQSEEIADILGKIFKELTTLDVVLNRVLIWIFNHEERFFSWWSANAELESNAESYRVDYNQQPVFLTYFEAWQKRIPLLLYTLSGATKDSWENFLFSDTELSRLPKTVQDGMKAEVTIFTTSAISDYGIMMAGSLEPLTDENTEVIQRFGKVFQQSYTRYLDVQKAEEQARESQIQLALERVRARTMAMQHSSELKDVAAILFKHVEEVGVNSFASGVHLWIEDGKAITIWSCTEGEMLPPFRLPLTDDPAMMHIYEAAQSGKDFHVEAMGGQALKEHYEYLFSFPDIKEIFGNLSNAGFPVPKFQIFHAAYFSYGYLMFITHEPCLEVHDIFKRFAKVFEQTYTRFLDLQKAEAQAKEAQIEAALERVRSRTLAMQKSDELAETAAVMFNQLIHLGIAPNRLYIGIINDESGDIEAWATDEDGSRVSKQFTLNVKNPSVRKIYDGWRENKKSVLIDMQGKELEDYLHYLHDDLDVPFKQGLTQKRRVQNIAYFSKGFIGIASQEEQPEETAHLLERFAAVFNLTYTRFNDLNIAEAHAEQAEQDLIAIKEAKQKAEEALTELQSTQKQLIQSEKMASLGELTAGIAHEIQNPLNFVNNFSEVSKELLDEMKVAIERGNTEDAKDIMNDVIQNLEKINHHGKRADGIVKGMLQHSSSGSGKKEPTDINTLADEYLRLAYHGLRAKDKSFNATMKTDFDESIGNINIVPQDIGRVILNLITNAFYAVSERKKNNETGFEPVVSVSTKKKRDAIEIRVKDNGTGIPDAVKEKIFQPFFTTKPTGQGTGLGLSLSYDIVKAQGGVIKVETKEGEGSEFIITLPVSVL